MSLAALCNAHSHEPMGNGQLTMCICQMNPGAKKERLLQNGEREAGKTLICLWPQTMFGFFGLVCLSVILRDVIS